MSDNMKQSDIRPCSGCGGGVMHAGSPVFYRVRVDHMVVDLGAVQRQVGLELMMGGGQAGAAVAAAMGPDADLAHQITTTTLVLCSECMLRVNVATLIPDGE